MFLKTYFSLHCFWLVVMPLPAKLTKYGSPLTELEKRSRVKINGVELLHLTS